MTSPKSAYPAAFPPPGPAVYSLRAAFAVGGRVAPGATARLAERLFCRPPRASMRPPERVFLDAATRGLVTTARGHRLTTYHWPAAGPTVLLMHGWGSHAGRWHVVAGALQAAGFALVAIDGPAHGATPGTLASLPEFAESLAATAKAVGPVHGVVGHSLGAAAIAVGCAYKGLETPRAVLIASPAETTRFADLMGRYLWWPARVRERMIRNIERRLGHNWSDFHIPSLVRARTEPALVIHDRDDHDVVFAEGEAIAAAWPGARLVETHGLGHRQILRDPAVAQQVADFLRA